ncbi:unnamed protein product [Linum tenue]|uniref:Uncharacterized protein n=1 Tax=Linum tenue TaxID=586396 RepID=A0AAV0S5W7_9ROSI|nr:unnamed protein product [Linum tenue]
MTNESPKLNQYYFHFDLKPRRLKKQVSEIECSNFHLDVVSKHKRLHLSLQIPRTEDLAANPPNQQSPKHSLSLVHKSQLQSPCQREH